MCNIIISIHSSSHMQTHSHSTDHLLIHSAIITSTCYHIPLHIKENTHRSVTTLKMPSCVLHTTGRTLTVCLNVATASTSSCQGVKFTTSKFPGLNSVPGTSSLALSLKTDSHRLVFNTVMTTWQGHVIVMPTFFQTLDTSTPQPNADKKPTFHFSPFNRCSVWCHCLHVHFWCNTCHEILQSLTYSTKGFWKIAFFLVYILADDQ